LASGDYDDAVKPSQANGSEHQADMSPPPAPPPQNNNFNGKEKQSVHIARADGDGIFVGDGVDYLVPKKEMSRSPVSVDMDEAVLFHCIMFGPVPPSESAQARQLPVSL
jgi:IK cytokine